MSHQVEKSVNHPVEKVLYTGRTHTLGGREGTSRSDDGRLEIALSQFGSSGKGTNPEQLFGAGWSACFLSAIGIVAAAKKIKLPAAAAVDTEVDLAQNGKDYLLQARLNVNLPGLDRDTAQELIRQAHQICPYSRATRGNINVEITLA